MNMVVNYNQGFGWYVSNGQDGYYVQGRKDTQTSRPSYYKTWRKAVESAQMDGFAFSAEELGRVKEKVENLKELTTKHTIVLTKWDDMPSYHACWDGDVAKFGVGGSILEAIGDMMANHDCSFREMGIMVES
jgi:hypothetical protein